MPGPVPKREEDRLRANAPEIPIDHVEVYGEVPVPELNLPFGADQMVIDFYESLKKSATARYYEPSDWEYARLTCFIMQTIVSAKKPSAEMFKALQTAMSNLLVTEGDRRRLRIEIAREAEKPKVTAEEEHMAEVIGMYQKQMERYTKEA